MFITINEKLKGVKIQKWQVLCAVPEFFSREGVQGIIKFDKGGGGGSEAHFRQFYFVHVNLSNLNFQEGDVCPDTPDTPLYF